MLLEQRANLRKALEADEPPLLVMNEMSARGLDLQVKNINPKRLAEFSGPRLLTRNPWPRLPKF